MTQPISRTILIDPDGGTILIRLNMKTILACPYRIDLRDKGNTMSVPPFPVTSDNTTSGEDNYELPGTARENDGRHLRVFVTIVDQTGDGGDYTVDLELFQNGKQIGRLSTQKKMSNVSAIQEYFAVLLRCGRNG